MVKEHTHKKKKKKKEGRKEGNFSNIRMIVTRDIK